MRSCAAGVGKLPRISPSSGFRKAGNSRDTKLQQVRKSYLDMVKLIKLLETETPAGMQLARKYLLPPRPGLS